MTTTNDRLAEIRARLDAATDGPWHKDDGEFGCVTIGNYGWTTPHGVNGPEYDVDSPQGHADAELIAHAPADLAHLLSLVDQLQGQLDEFATLQDRIPDDGNGDWGLGWDHGYNAALAEVRAMAARPPAQEHASGSNTPDPYTGEGTAPASPHEPAQAAIDTIARVLVGTDWDEEVPYTDIGPRETVAHLAGQIATVLAPAHYREAAASLRALGHDTAADLLESTARDLEEGDTTE